MKPSLGIFAIATLLFSAVLPAAEITDVADAADKNNPFDVFITVGFHSTLERAKITQEWAEHWNTQGWGTDYDQLRYERQTYTMDYRGQIGLYKDLELHFNLPWIIQDTQKVDWVTADPAIDAKNGTMFCSATPITDCQPGYAGASLAADPSTDAPIERAGLGDLSVGLAWAAFNQERDDTKSTWVIGFDMTLPTGKVAKPDDIATGSKGQVGLGQLVFTPSTTFSHRYKILDPYFGLHASIPVQSSKAKDVGIVVPWTAGFLVGFEIVPWEDKHNHQKFAIDLRLSMDRYGEVESMGKPNQQGTFNEMSDFLLAPTTHAGAQRQLQAQSPYSRLGGLLGFNLNLGAYARFRMGVELSHQTEHFLTGAESFYDKNGSGGLQEAGEPANPNFNRNYDIIGRRIRILETTLFTYFGALQLTF